MLWSWSLWLALSPTCPEGARPVTALALESTLKLAQDGANAGDLAKLAQHADSLLGQLGCLSEPISPGLARDIHELVAKAQLVTGDSGAAAAAAQAVLSLGGAPLNPVWFPAENQQLQALLQPNPSPQSWALPAPGQWRVDGAAGQEALTLQQAAIVQRVDPSPPWTWYLRGTESPEALEALFAAPAAAPAAGQPPRTASSSAPRAGAGPTSATGGEATAVSQSGAEVTVALNPTLTNTNTVVVDMKPPEMRQDTTVTVAAAPPLSRRLLAAATLSAVASGATLWGAGVTYGQYMDLRKACVETPCDPPTGLRPLNNGLWGAGVSLGVGSAGLALSAVIVQDW